MFYGLAPDRVKILSDLVSEVLSLGKSANPLRMLLMNRYFNSQSKADNVVSIVPALVNLNSALRTKKTAAGAKDSKDEKAADKKEEDEKVASLLERVSVLLLNDTKARLTEVFAAARGDVKGVDAKASASSSSSSSASASKPPPASASSGIDTGLSAASFNQTLRDFLARAQVCLLTAYLSSGSSSASDVTGVSDGEHATPFVFSYALQVMSLAEALTTSAYREANALVRARSSASASSSMSVSVGETLSAVSDALKTSVGSLLRPLFTGLWRLPLDVKSASQLLPSLFRLLCSLDRLASIVRLSLIIRVICDLTSVLCLFRCRR